MKGTITTQSGCKDLGKTVQSNQTTGTERKTIRAPPEKIDNDSTNVLIRARPHRDHGTGPQPSPRSG